MDTMRRHSQDTKREQKALVLKPSLSQGGADFYFTTYKMFFISLQKLLIVRTGALVDESFWCTNYVGTGVLQEQWNVKRSDNNYQSKERPNSKLLNTQYS